MAITAIENRVTRELAMSIDIRHARLAFQEFEESGDTDEFRARARIAFELDYDKLFVLNMTTVSQALKETYKTRDLPESVYHSKDITYIGDYNEKLVDILTAHADAIKLLAVYTPQKQLEQYVADDYFRCKDWRRIRVLFDDEIKNIQRKNGIKVIEAVNKARKVKRLTPLERKKVYRAIETLKTECKSIAELVFALCTTLNIESAQLADFELTTLIELDR